MNIFRKIRKQLADQNKISEYTRYALGEIILIMLGIFMALQLQNWNQNRKQNLQFEVLLEKVYNSLHYDLDYQRRLQLTIQRSINNLNGLLNSPDELPNDEKPYLLFAGIGFTSGNSNSEVQSYLQELRSEYTSEAQSAIVRQIVQYNAFSENENFATSGFNGVDLIRFLMDYNIHFPKVSLEKINSGFDISDSLYYSESQLKTIDTLLKGDALQSRLKSYSTQLTFNYIKSFNLSGMAKSIIMAIEGYYPEVSLIYENVGIIGTSLNGFDDVGGTNTPMTEVDLDRKIWEATLYLKEGKVKFRCNDSWAINWGAPFGLEDKLTNSAVSQGGDIEIKEAGRYHIQLNLTDFTYNFKKLSD